MRDSVISAAGMEFPLCPVNTLIVGSGAAGLNAAVSLLREGQRDIAIVTEGKSMGTSLNTGSDKQTYYKLTCCSGEPDSVRQMAQTLFDGGAVDGDTALVEAALSARAFFHLVDLGVPFPHNGMGEYAGYKTDHDPFRRGTSAGPLTSRYMTEKLLEQTEREGVKIYDGYTVIELLTAEEKGEKRVCGALAVDRNGRFLVFSASNIVYAVGGEAGMYAASVYPPSQTGGLGPAFRAGALGKNLTESQYGIASVAFRWNLSGSYQQVIPRYVSTDRDGQDEKEFLDPFFDTVQHLLGAVFLKGYQWPFDPRKIREYGSSLIDLLVYRETVLLGRRVFLDFRRNPSASEENGIFHPERIGEEGRTYLEKSGVDAETPIARLKQMNPAAAELYLSHGINLEKEMLEIAVCAQHNNGGLAGNAWWESNLRHFFPVGEANGSHGVYRPGGSALNAGQTGGIRAAEYIAQVYREDPYDGKRLADLCGEQIREAVRFGLRALERENFISSVNLGAVEPGDETLAAAESLRDEALTEAEQRYGDEDPGRRQNESMLDLDFERKLLGIRMSRYGANIRSLEGVQTALAGNREQLLKMEGGKLSDGKQLPRYYRLRDLLISQRVYLEAIRDYILHGGQSRGSYLISSRDGELPLEGLPEIFRMKEDGGNHAGEIQEILYAPEGSRVSWRARRPLPDDENWFETVWRRYREGSYFADTGLNQKKESAVI